MTAKEKAESLVLSYLRIPGIITKNHDWFNKILAKKCALIAVEELIKEQTMWQNGETNPVLFWQEVKEEINKL